MNWNFKKNQVCLFYLIQPCTYLHYRHFKVTYSWFKRYVLYVMNIPLLLFRRNVATGKADCWRTSIKWWRKHMRKCSCQILKLWPSSYLKSTNGVSLLCVNSHLRFWFKYNLNNLWYCWYDTTRRPRWTLILNILIFLVCSGGCQSHGRKSPAEGARSTEGKRKFILRTYSAGGCCVWAIKTLIGLQIVQAFSLSVDIIYVPSEVLLYCSSIFHRCKSVQRCA